MGELLIRELGLTRFFGAADLGAANLSHGWASPEPAHNWNEGFDASLILKLETPPEQVCLLTIEAKPHLAAQLTRQDVTFYFNGLRLGFWRLETPALAALEVEIEPEYWLKRAGETLGRCTWHLPDSTRPSDISDQQDERLLGLCFQTLTLSRRPAPRR
jgi:hypothetical protein